MALRRSIASALRVDDRLLTAADRSLSNPEIALVIDCSFASESASPVADSASDDRALSRVDWCGAGRMQQSLAPARRLDLDQSGTVIAVLGGRFGSSQEISSERYQMRASLPKLGVVHRRRVGQVLLRYGDGQPRFRTSARPAS